MFSANGAISPEVYRNLEVLGTTVEKTNNSILALQKLQNIFFVSGL